MLVSEQEAQVYQVVYSGCPGESMGEVGEPHGSLVLVGVFFFGPEMVACVLGDQCLEGRPE